jgi:tetratricopeptide (TPR) repeat protein
MILRLSTRAERGVILLAAMAAAAVLSFFSVRNACAVYFSGLETRYGYIRAIELEPDDARNWFLLGRYWQYNLDESDGRQAIIAYRKSLSIDPHSAQTWADLATAYESEGDIRSARDAFVAAKRAYPLSADVSWRYGNFLLRQGEFDSAFAEIHHAVEADPRRGAEAFSRCIRFEPDIQVVLDRVIPPFPHVYADIMNDLAANGRTDDALKVWQRLVDLDRQIPIQEVFPLVDALRRKNLIPEAYRVWTRSASLAGISVQPVSPGSTLWDGGFESSVTGGAYGWTIPPDVHGVQSRIDSQEKHSGGHSLRMSFDGKSNVNYSGACITVPVQPSGSYVFTAWVHTRGVTTDQGIRFQIRPLGSLDSSSALTPDFRGNMPWTQIQLPWMSGPGIQEAQICLLRNPSGQPDNRIQGQIWVDDLALTPQFAENSHP